MSIDFKIDTSKLLQKGQDELKNENYNLAEFYFNLAFLSNKIDANIKLCLNEELSNIYLHESKNTLLLRIYTLTYETLRDAKIKIIKDQYLQIASIFYNVACLSKKINKNLISTFFQYKLSNYFLTQFTKNNPNKKEDKAIELTKKLKEFHPLKDTLQDHFKEIKSKQYDILNSDQTDFEKNPKEELYKAIDAKIKTKLIDISENDKDIKNNEPFYLISFKWYIQYINFMEFMMEIKDSPEDYKNFLISGFDISKFFKLYKSDDSINKENSYLYPGQIRNEVLIDFNEDMLEDIYDENNFSDICIKESAEGEFLQLKSDQWNCLVRDFGCDYEIKRFKRNNTIEAILKKCYVIIFDDELRDKYPNMIKEKCVQLSHFDTVLDLLNKIKRIIKSDCNVQLNTEKVKIFLSKDKTSLTQFKIAMSYVNKVLSEYYIDCVCLEEKELQKELRTFEDNPLFIIQTDKSEFIKEKSKEIISHCTYCNKSIGKNAYYCDKDECYKIEVYSYCNEECMVKDTSHLNFHNFLSQYRLKRTTIADLNNMTISSLINKEQSLHGLVGLVNLGNTCFMNSALQCLSNCENLTKFFLSDKYSQEINMNNKLGTKGKIAEAYHDLISNLWNSNEPHLAPQNFRGIFVHFVRQFSDYSQQDSNEVLIFLLDKLHEDLNRISKKPYIEMKTQESKESDEEASERWWRSYLKRENSMIVDLFYGQYKSKITCPECGFISITYDPFMFLSLPIPTARYQLKIKFFPLIENVKENNKFIYEEYNLLITKNLTCQELKNKIIRLYKIKELSYEEIDLILFDKGQNIISKLTSNEYLYSKIFKQNLSIYAYEKKNNKDNIYCYLTRYSIKYSFFGLIPNEQIEYILKFPIALSVEDKDEIAKIYKNVNIHIIKRFNVSPNQSSYDKGRELNSLDKKFSNLSINNEELTGFILHLRKFGYGKNSYCDFCGSTVYKNYCHTCRFISRFSKKEIYGYIKQCIANKDKVVELNIDIKDTIEIKDINDNLKANEYKNDEFGELSSFNNDNCVNIYDCLNLFCSEEKLEKDNMWYCCKCKKHQEAFKKLDIFFPPEYLIIQLKRFKTETIPYSYTYSLFRSVEDKNSALVKFPITNLDLSNFVLGKQKEKSSYDLIGVSQHYGGMSFGHYTAVCKNGGEWYCFNDNNVSKITEDEIVTKAAYILFYKKNHK